MLELLTYRAAFGQPSASPFCVKAMCLLGMSGMAWRRVDCDDPRKMPYGKMPVLRSGTRLIPDSEEIRAYLEAGGAEFDPGLSPYERAVSRAVIRMAEEHLYFLLLLDRWMDPAAWAETRAAFFGAVPGPLRRPVGAMIRRKILRDVRGQGLGRLTPEARRARAERDLAAISGLLNRKDYLFADRPTASDASLGPLLAALVTSPVASPLSRRVRDDPVLAGYAARVAAALFP